MNGLNIPFFRAEQVAKCLFAFPYQNLEDVPLYVKEDSALLEIIEHARSQIKYTDGRISGTNITAAERMSLQGKFKEKIYPLLELCLANNSNHIPAIFLYVAVAEHNTRAGHRESLIALYERFRPSVEAVKTNSESYELIKNDIQGMGGNYFETVERHLADFHYELARLYRDSSLIQSAKEEFKKSIKLCPQVYGNSENKISL